MVLQRLVGWRDLGSPRLKSRDSVLWSLRRLSGDFALSARGDEAKPRTSLHLDLGRGEETMLLKKCTTAFSLVLRRDEDCWGEEAR